MRESSLRPLSSAWARSIRRVNTSGARVGSWKGSMRNAECGMRNCTVGRRFRIPHSAFRIGYAATAPARVKNSRLSIVLAPPRSAAYIIRPPGPLEGVGRMSFEARIEPLDGKLPKVSYHWDPETDILSVACKGDGEDVGLRVPMVADLGKLAVERLDARLEAHAADTFQWSGRADNIGRTSGRGQDDGEAGVFDSGGGSCRVPNAECGMRNAESTSDRAI